MLNTHTSSLELNRYSACRRTICRHAAVGACAVLQQSAVAAAVGQQQPVAVAEPLSEVAERATSDKLSADAALQRQDHHQHQPQQHWQPQQQQLRQPQQEHLQYKVPLPQPIKWRRWSEHHASLLRTLRQQPDLLPRGCRVLLAVSGGQVGNRYTAEAAAPMAMPALLCCNAQKASSCACRHTVLLATHAYVT
jgi:hypothetical protein